MPPWSCVRFHTCMHIPGWTCCCETKRKRCHVIILISTTMRRLPWCIFLLGHDHSSFFFLRQTPDIYGEYETCTVLALVIMSIMIMIQLFVRPLAPALLLHIDLDPETWDKSTKTNSSREEWFHYTSTCIDADILPSRTMESQQLSVVVVVPDAFHDWVVHEYVALAVACEWLDIPLKKYDHTQHTVANEDARRANAPSYNDTIPWTMERD